MKKLLTFALTVLVVVTAFIGLSHAQRQPGPAIPIPLPGHKLTVQVIGPQCPPPASAVVKNAPPWGAPGQYISCSSSGGPDCSELNIPPGTPIYLSTSPLFPSGGWSGNLGTNVTPGTCGYYQLNKGHERCEFKMPPHGVDVRVELPCPPPPVTSCQDDLNSGKLTITGPTVSNVTASSAQLTGSVSVTPPPPPPTGCTYTAKLVWGQPPSFPNTSNALTTAGPLPPSTSPLNLSGTATPLQPSTGYGARIEVTKQCGGIAPTACIGSTKFFETPKGEGKCDLVIGKSPTRGTTTPLVNGQQVTFEFVVTNQGNGTCQAPISVTDNFSQGLTYMSGGTSGWICPTTSITGPNSVTCTNSGPLAPNQSSLLLVTFNVTAPPPTMVGDCGIVKNPNDTNTANNRACIELPVEKPKLPDLTIKKQMSCPGPTTAQGIKCIITFTITNNGPGTFNGILALSDMLTPAPSSLSWAGATPPGWSCSVSPPSNEISCATTNPVSLAPPGSTTFSIDVYIPAGQYDNCASVKGYTQFPYTSSTLIQEVTSNNNRDCVPIQVGTPCRDVTMNLSTGQNPNWTVNPGAVGVITNLGSLSGIWIPPGPASWIQPATATTPQLLQGGIFYQYSVPFTLNNPALYSSIQITGRYAADNGVPAGVSMNNGPGVSPCTGPNCFSSWHPFTITQTANIPVNNNLDVRVYNNPTGGTPPGPTHTGLIVDATLRAICKR